MSHDKEEWCKIWKKADLLFQKWQESSEFWPEHSRVSKTCTLMSSFWPKYIIFELKKYRRVIFSDPKEGCKIWRKTNLWFGNWHEEFDKFSPEHLKFPKLGLWLDPFIQGRNYMSWEFTEEL